MSDPEKYNVTVEQQPDAPDPKAEVAGKTAAAATPTVTSVPAAAAPSVDAATTRQIEENARQIERISNVQKNNEISSKEKAAAEEREKERADARDIRKDLQVSDADIRNKDFYRIMAGIICGALVSVIGTLGTAYFTALRVGAVENKLDDQTVTVDKTFHYVNSATLANLKSAERTARRLFMLTKEPEDEKDWQDAARLVEEHEAADVKIEASKKSKKVSGPKPPYVPPVSATAL